ncbi:MAG: aminoacetone oxidase family FAD-binding enzyme [Eubacteriales bacterium]|nr:aminoacetone oxidase family FAD-binding enzyme [Eubacteriales bacterium]
MKQEKKVYDCAVIGGGAAGLFGAVWLARKGLKVIVIEHTKKVGTKILQTGNGKCNFTNMKLDYTCFQSGNEKQVMEVVNRFDNRAAIEFFESVGVYHRERNGYVYPHSDTALSLQNGLRMEIEKQKVRLSTEFETKKIVYCDNVFEIISDSYTYYADTVLLATGSKAGPKTGSDGSGYIMAESLGHHIIKPLPALVQLVSKDKECRLMAGVRSTGRIVLYVDGEAVSSDIGEIQYTEYGISGIPVFQISRYAVKALDMGRSVSVTIDMLPDYTYEYAKEICEKGIACFPDKNVEQFFEGIINKKLVSAVAGRCKISASGKAKDLGSRELFKCVEMFKNYRVNIDGYKDFDNAQVCQGGVPLDEIDTCSMMSKIKPGVFFAGELLDVDGKCGGYNLQWAWSSAAVAAHGVEEYLKNKKV